VNPAAPPRVVVLTYNRADLTRSCVKAVLEQEYDPLDVMVVDNHSSQQNYDELTGSLPDGVALIRADSNRGYAAGNNLGARSSVLARPAYVMFLNNDVILQDKHTCGALVAALERDPDRVACSPLVDTPNVLGLPPEATVQVRRIPGFLQLLVAHSWWLRRLPGLRRISDWYTYADSRPYARGTETDCESINGSCFVARDDFLRDIGYLDEGTFLYHEEIVLGRRIQDCGKKACLVTSTAVLHNQGSTTEHGQGRVSFRMLRHMVNSEMHYCRRYLQVPAIALGILACVRGVDILGKAVASALGWGSRRG
jgi:GT2 family glycosyltransferase